MDTVSYLLGKKNGGGSGTTNYNDLSNKPSINDVALSGNKTSSDLGIQEELVSGTNIKTINNQSILGSGDITISGGGDGETVSIFGDATTYLTIDFNVEDLKTGIYKPQFARQNVRFKKNNSYVYSIELMDDFIVLKDYSEAENNEIFAVTKYYDSGSSPRITDKYFKKTNSGMGVDYSRMGNMPNSGKDIYINSLEDKVLSMQWTFNKLPESSVVPTTNNQLTNKKYVDDKPTTYAGYDATKTQVLKNINGTLTWVDE